MDKALQEMTLKSPTEFWNDSCSAAELTDAISYGATGGTSNPTIVAQVLKKELETWKPLIVQLFRDNPTANEDFIAWKTIEAIAMNAAAVSLALLSLAIAAYYEYESDFLDSYGLPLVAVLLLSTVVAYALFYGRGGVKYLFNRQLHEFVGSPEYRALDEYFRNNFGQPNHAAI